MEQSEEINEIKRDIQRIKSFLDTMMAWIPIDVLTIEERQELLEILQGKR